MNPKGSSRKDQFINIGLLAFICLAAALTILSGIKVYNIRRTYSERDKTYSDMANMYTQVMSDFIDEPSTQISQEKDKSDFPIKVNFADLNAECRFGSVAGWIYSPGTLINYPIAQCDDNYYYLYHLLDGSENPGGSIYCDFTCLQNFSGQTTLLYGHHMADGSMFASLKNYYQKPDYYSEHPYMYLATPAGNYRLDVFSAFSTITEDEKSFATSFNSDFTYQDYLNHLMALNSISGMPTIDISTSDRIVVLCTCAYDTNNSRTIVAAVMRPEN